MIARMRPVQGRVLARALLLAGFVLPLTGCLGSGKHAERKIPQYGIVDPNLPRELQMVSQPPYVIEPPDQLEIAVRPTALEIPLTTALVQPDGTIDFGFLGEIYLAGLTLSEAEAKIAQTLAPLAARRRLREPIEVAVRNVTPRGDSSKRYYVLGTVTTQGSFPITGNETVVDGILQAGLRSNSLPEKAYLARPHPAGGPPQIFRIEWEAIKLGDTVTNYQLFPGDRIIVPGGRAPGLISTLLGGG
jgi:polysaccharide export outer membrane protein